MRQDRTQPAGAGHPYWLELKATLALSWPLVLANLAQIGMTTTDVVLLGRLSREALAAGALAGNLYHATLIFGIGLVTAVSPLLAEEFGRRRHAVREARRTVRQGLWTAVIITLPLWVLLWNGERILLLLGQEPRLAADAGAYLRAFQWTLLPVLLFMVLRHFMAALERPGWALAAALVTLVVNGILAWALIFGRLGAPALGLVGAGIATSIATTLQLLMIVAVLLRERRFRRYRLFGRLWRADWSRMARIWRIGTPIGVILMFEITVFNAAAFLQGLLGATSLAAHAIALQIAATSFMVPLGVSQAATVRVGRAYGAKDPAGVARAGWTAFGFVMAFMSMTALLMVLVPDMLVGLFIDLSLPGGGEVAQLAATFLLVAALFQLADGAQAALSGMLRGLQDTFVPMLLAGFGYWVIGFGLAVYLGFRTELAGLGIWFGLAAGLAAVAACLGWRWLARGRIGLVPAPEGLRTAAAER